jgi:uncharacterized SAM-binding protein YcdF (DUF218 family)
VRAFFIFSGIWLSRCAFCLSLLWLAGLVIFGFYARSWQAPSGLLLTDGIAVFTGEAGRIRLGLDLFYIQKERPFLHFSGCYQRLKHLSHPKISEDRATNTFYNIQQTLDWIQKHHIHSVRLVTSDYHMPRCFLLAQRFWPPDVRVLWHPLHSKRIGSLGKWALEYTKYLRCLLLKH